jgi:hypothetical protein
MGLLLLAPGFVMAQQFTGQVRGAVRDDGGGVLPGTTVSLVNVETQASRTSITNERGEYVFASVAPGRYNLMVTLAGFAPYTREALEVGVASQLVQDVTMSVGGIAESVTVTGETPLIETASASIASAIDKAQMEVLPTPGRNVFIMAVTTPNVVHAGDPVFVRMQDQSNASLLSLGGGPQRGNNYTLDGVGMTDFTNRGVINPSFESLEEMKVQIATYDAEMGRTAGGVFNSVHKSGSNNWAGSGLYQWRPTWGRSPTFFQDRVGQDASIEPYHLWGGSFGGPIARDKAFFWFATEGYKNKSSRVQDLNFPTQAMANGDFSGVGYPIYDPLTGAAFPGGVIPANRINPVGANLANQLVEVGDACIGQGGANVPGIGRTCSITALLDNKAYQLSGNVNTSVTDNWQLTGTYMYYKSEEPANPFYTAVFGSQPVYDTGSAILFRDVNLVALNSTHITGDASVLTLRFGYNRFNDSVDNPEFTSAQAAAFGWDAATVDAIGINQFPQISTDGYGDLDTGLSHGSWGNVDRVHSSTEFSGVYSQFIGAHTVKIGGVYRQYKIDWFNQAPMQFNFPQRFTEGAGSDGNGIATMLLGLPDTGRAQIAASNSNDILYGAGFIQDDWRVNENLVLNLGLRIEHETGMGEANDQMIYGWDFDNPFPVNPTGNLTGGTLYAGLDGAPTRTGDPPSMKFGPRAGFAYTLNENAVLRGGFGIFWAPLAGGGPSLTNHANLGFSADTTYNSFERGGAGTVSNPFPLGVNPITGASLGRFTNAGQDVTFIDQFATHPDFKTWSLEYQHEMGNNVAVTVGYLGSKGSNLRIGGTNDSSTNVNQLDPTIAAAQGASLNEQVPNPLAGQGLGASNDNATVARGQLLRPFPQFQNVFAKRVDTGRSNYNAVKFVLEKRFRGNWGAKFNYTYSDQKDNIYESANRLSDEETVIHVTGRNDADYGYSMMSSRHWLNISGLYRLPSPDGGVAETILGGWSASVTAIMREGFPMTIKQSSNWGGAFGYDHQRPNVTGATKPTSGSTADRADNYINQDAYAFVPDFQIGNAPLTDSDLRSPWLYNWDLSFEKMTRIGDNQNLNIRLEFVNFFNQPNWNGPRSVFGQNNFGQITGQGGYPRVFQVMLKYMF